MAGKTNKLKTDPRIKQLTAISIENLEAERAIVTNKKILRHNKKLTKALMKDLRKDYTGYKAPRKRYVILAVMGVLSAVIGASIFTQSQKKIDDSLKATFSVKEAQAQVIEQPVKEESKPAEPEKVAIPNNSGLPSQEQKNIAAEVCKKIAVNRQKFLEGIHVSPGMFVSTCYTDVLAMAYAESRFNCSAIGDQGKSRGCFQIQTKLHNVSVKDAENFRFAAEWTMDRLVRDSGYPKTRTYAISVHNGSGPAAQAYAAAVKAKSSEFQRIGL